MTFGQMVTLFMKYYNSHSSIILECQNQLYFYKEKTYYAYINMENKFLWMPKVLPDFKDYFEMFFKHNTLLS